MLRRQVGCQRRPLSAVVKAVGRVVVVDADGDAEPGEQSDGRPAADHDRDKNDDERGSQDQLEQQILTNFRMTQDSKDKRYCKVIQIHRPSLIMWHIILPSALFQLYIVFNGLRVKDVQPEKATHLLS